MYMSPMVVWYQKMNEESMNQEKKKVWIRKAQLPTNAITVDTSRIPRFHPPPPPPSESCDEVRIRPLSSGLKKEEEGWKDERKINKNTKKRSDAPTNKFLDRWVKTYE